MNEKFKATLKSSETEDWLDLHVIRPFCYYCAVFFAKFDVHPNTITIWSMIIGAASAWFFAQGSFYYDGWLGLVYNIIGIFLLMWGDIFDCTDGRRTGRLYLVLPHLRGIGDSFLYAPRPGVPVAGH